MRARVASPVVHPWSASDAKLSRNGHAEPPAHLLGRPSLWQDRTRKDNELTLLSTHRPPWSLVGYGESVRTGALGHRPTRSGLSFDRSMKSCCMAARAA